MSIALPSIEQPFTWLNGVGELTPTGDAFCLTASAETDWFINPDTETVQSAPALVTPAPPGDFVLGAHVHARTAAKFDAGVLFAYGDDRTWAKLYLERSPDNELMVVSVVTRGTSDDSNSEVVDGDAAWLRIARVGGAMAFHWSVDGARWGFVRQFRLGSGEL